MLEKMIQERRYFNGNDNQDGLQNEPAYEGQNPVVEERDDQGNVIRRYIKPITVNSTDNNPYIVTSFGGEYEAMKDVLFEVRVPQNAKVYNMIDGQGQDQEMVYITENNTYTVDDFEPGEGYVGFNPVRVKVPNKTIKLTGNNKIIENNTTITLNDMKNLAPQNERNMYVGCDEVTVEIPEQITIPVFTESEEKTVINEIPEITESMNYSILQWKADNLDNIPDDIPIASIVGFNEIKVNIPNKLVNMSNEQPNSPYNTGTINRNGSYDIDWWRNNSNAQDKDEYIGFNNIKVDVQLDLIKDTVIEIPYNNYILNINNYWNNDHPNDKKEGFNNITLHFNDSGGDNPDLVNAIISNNNTNQQLILTEIKDIVMKQTAMTPQTLETILGRVVDGMGQVVDYTFKNISNNGHPTMMVNSLYNLTGNQVQFRPEINVGDWVDRFLTQNDWIQLKELLGGEQNVRMLTDAFHINALTQDNQGNSIPVFSNDNQNNFLPGPTSLFRDIPILKKQKTRDISVFDVVNYVNNFIFSTNDINTIFNRDYYCTWQANCRMETEMLAYDKIIIDKNDLGSIVTYDIENDFIYNNEKNPVIPVDPERPDGPGLPQYNPLGLRQLNIDLTGINIDINNYNPYPQNNPLVISSRNYNSSINYDSNNYTGLDNIYIQTQIPSDVDNANVNENNIITSRSGTYNIPSGKTGFNSFTVNIPSDVNNYNPYTQNNPLQISNNGNGSITFDSSLYTGLSNIYYNVNIATSVSTVNFRLITYYTNSSNRVQDVIFEKLNAGTQFKNPHGTYIRIMKYNDYWTMAYVGAPPNVYEQYAFDVYIYGSNNITNAAINGLTISSINIVVYNNDYSKYFCTYNVPISDYVNSVDFNYNFLNPPV